MAEETTTVEEQKRAALPKTIADIEAISHVPTTEATASFARFVNKYLKNADNFDGITEEQAWTVIGCHRVWQQSEERAAEKEQLKKDAAAAKEAEDARKAEKAEERKAEKARKDAERKRKAEEKAAKKAAEADSSDDLEEVESEGSGPIETPKRKRRPRATKAEDAPAEETSDAPVAEDSAAL